MNVYNCHAYSCYPESPHVTNWNLWPEVGLKPGSTHLTKLTYFFTENMHVKVLFYYLHVVSE